MPTYDYLCAEGHEFTTDQSVKDDALTICLHEFGDGNMPTHCGAPCKRQIGSTSFKFKGGNPTPKHFH